ncbi:MAG: TIM barrel protein [Oscillospiraceae bacterium]|nr:TIM barrel protein [Oscillospiraceae bacterium]MDY2847522.1 TIM barrel protein [Oscillospiraceae bacterium]
MSAKFGPAGAAESFKTMGYKKTIQIGEYLNKFGLDHFEYQCGQGVRIGEAPARELGKALSDCGITVSVHAPYFISLSSVEEEKRDNSINYILASARAVDFMGGDRIVIHSGSCSKMTREEALALAKETMKKARQALIDNGLEHIHCCPETMGKINQLGDLSEVLEICSVDDSFIPTIDFGHLNARTLGSIKTKADYAAILDEIENRLGHDRAKIFHSHFSKIEYTEKGGEKKHLTFEDEIYGPQYEPLMELIYERGLSPTFICESAGTQTEDAQTMKLYYEGLMG